MDTATKPALVGEDDFCEAYPALLRFCRHLTAKHTNATHDAEDLAQNAIAKGWEKRRQFKRQSKLSFWLVRIANNLYITDRRCRQLQWDQQALSLMDDFALSHDCPTNTLDPEDILMSQQARNAIASSHPHYLATLDLALKGFNYPEIADELDTIPATVKSRMHRIHSVLREKYAKRAHG